MDNKTLVLNNNYQAIQVICWEDALCLIFLNKAERVIDYEDFIVRSVSQEFKVPSVLRVKSKFKIKDRILSLNRNNIFKRDRYTCAYCGGRFSRNELTIDHIIPLSRGGDRKSWDNLISACGECNHKKSNKMLEEINMELLFKPIEPIWTPKTGLQLYNYPKEWEDWIY